MQCLVYSVARERACDYTRRELISKGWERAQHREDGRQNRIDGKGRSLRLSVHLHCLAQHRLAWFLVVLCTCLGASAQAAPQADAPSAPDSARLDQVPRVPGAGTLLHGLNAGVTFSGVHDSSIGWYTIATPALSYTISRHFAADVSFSIYPTREVKNDDPGAPPNQQLVLETGELSDTFVGLHGSFSTRKVRNTATVSFTLPSGDNAEGLGAGKVTFDFSDHMERYVRKTSFLLDIGAGDSSGLFNRMVAHDYTSVGKLAHFQEGVAFWLFGRDSIQCVAYEQVPIGNQTLYTNPGPPGSSTLTVVSGNGLGHDNGVTTSVGIPLTANLTLSGYYNRSFAQSLDTVSVGFTYVLRGRPELRKLSMIDRALREAEGANQLAH